MNLKFINKNYLPGILMIILCGCAFSHELSVKPVRKVSIEEKIPIRVALELSPDFCNYHYSWQMGVSDRHNFPLGKAFRRGAEMVSEAAFFDVSVTSKDVKPPAHKIAGIITPQVIHVDIMGAPWKGYRQTTLMMIKWTFTDHSGKIIWVKTCKGEADDKGKGWLEMVQASLDDLFRKSLESILSSQEIKKFAESTTNGK